MAPADKGGVELVQRGFAAFSSGDWDEALRTMHPKVEWHAAFPLPDLPPGKTVFRGREEVRELWGAFASIWETISIEMEATEHVSGGDGTWLVVARARFRGVGGSCGVEVDRVVHYVVDAEDGLLLGMRPFDTEAEAIEAAGVDPGP